MKNNIYPSQVIPFVGVTLCSATAVLLTVGTDPTGRIGMDTLSMVVYLLLGLFADIVLAPMPEEYKTPWPALLTWSALMAGLAHFLPKFL